MWFKKPISLNKKFDLAISLEVAKHIESDFAEIFINNITSISDIIIFGAAFPNVRGTSHINCQFPEYWEKIFKEMNYNCYDIIRPFFGIIIKLNGGIFKIRFYLLSKGINLKIK